MNRTLLLLLHLIDFKGQTFTINKWVVFFFWSNRRNVTTCVSACPCSIRCDVCTYNQYYQYVQSLSWVNIIRRMSSYKYYDLNSWFYFQILNIIALQDTWAIHSCRYVLIYYITGTSDRREWLLLLVVE